MAWLGLSSPWHQEFQPKEACLEGHASLVLFHVVTQTVQIAGDTLFI